MPYLVNRLPGRRALAGCLIAIPLVLGIAACGSSSGSSGTTASATGAQFTARLNFAKCMRRHGVNIPDPSSGGGPAGGGGAFRVLRSYPQAQRQVALQACQTYLRQSFPTLSPTQLAQFRQQAVKYAECMRSRGVNISDPTFNGTGGGFGIGRELRSIDRNSPAFIHANTSCGSLRPRFGRLGGGGGAPAGAAGA